MIQDDLKARLFIDRQIVGFAQVMGADTELPDIDKELEAFDEWLASPPKDILNGETEERRSLMQALGLRQ